MINLRTQIVFFSVIAILAVAAAFINANVVSAALQVLTGPQGGTGIGTTTAGNVGKCLSVSSINPLIYVFGACSGGGGGGSYPFTPGTFGISNTSATSTFINDTVGFISTGTSTLFNLSSLNSTSTNATTTNLAITSVVAHLLQTNAAGAVFAAIAGTDYQAAGNYITALTSDVTASGPGSVAATIAANAVSYAKFQQVSANRLVGNPTGVTANATEVSTTSLYALGIAGNVLMQTGVGTWVASPTTTNSCSSGIACSLAGNTWSFTNTGVLTTRNINTTYPLKGGGSLASDLTLTNDLSTTTNNTWSGANIFTNASTTFVGNATTTGYHFSGTASSSLLFGAMLAPCTGATFLQWTAGQFSCATPAAGSGTFPFEVGTNYGSTSNSTSTPIWFKQAVQASSTIYVGTGVVGSSSIQYGATGYEWVAGSFGADNTFRISSSTALVVSPALTIDKNLKTTLISLLATNATTTNLSVTSSSTLATMFGAGLSACTGTSALTWSAGLFTCTAQPQGTVTAVNGTANQIDSSGGATPTLALSNHVIFPASYQALRGTTTNATSTNLSVIGSSTVGTTFNVGSAIQDNGSLVVNGQTTLASSLSGLALLTSGVVSAYGGAAACTNQFVTAISSVGGTTCATLTGAAFGTVSANTWFGNPTGVAATPGFNATSTLFTGTAGQNAYFNGTGLLVGTSSLFVNTSTGNIGIDDTTPDFNLEIATANSNGYFGVTNVNDGDVFMIANSSNIGVGTTTPGYLLELASSSASQLVLSDGSISSTQWGFRNTGGTLYIGTSSPATYATSTVSAIQINSTGNPQVSIGSSSPQAMLSLHLGSTTLFANNNAILVGSTSASNNATTTLFQLSNTGWAYFPNAQGSGANQTGYWCYDATGQLIRDTTVCLVSALKFKKDINPLTLGLDTVMAMKPVTYYLKQSFSKEDAGQHIGFVADWSESVVPDLVTHDSNGDVHGFDYQAYTAVLTKAMQELNNKVNDLKIGRITRTAEENWQWLAIGLLVVWNIWLTLRKKK